MYLMKLVCDLTLEETARRFNVASYGAVGWACSGVRQQMRSDNRFRQEVERIRARISQQKT